MTSSSCSGLFVCTAVLCLNYSHLKYSFFNLTECTPKPIYFKAKLYLIADNTRSSNLGKESLNNGFLCSDCTHQNFRARLSNTSDHCYRQTTRIKLKHFCVHRPAKPPCQCFLSNQSIQPITDWAEWTSSSNPLTHPCTSSSVPFFSSCYSAGWSEWYFIGSNRNPVRQIEWNNITTDAEGKRNSV